MQRAFRFVGAHSQFFNLIFEEKFFALQFDDVQIVGRRMKLFAFDFSLESFVTALEFRKMAMHRHRAIPFEIADDRTSVHDFERARKRKEPPWLIKNP